MASTPVQPQLIASIGNRSLSNAPLIENPESDQIVVPAVRKLEFFIAFLVLTIAACFFVELGYGKPNSSEVLRGLFVPQLKGHGATGLAISLLGAMVMPHNLFLHSALVLSRKIPRSVPGIKEACRFYMIESGFALMVAFLINVSVISVSGAESCKDLDLNKASFLLRVCLCSCSNMGIYYYHPSISHLASNQIVLKSISNQDSWYVIGTAFALNMLFNIPVWCGVLLTGLSTLVLLALQQYGVRKLEFFIAFLVLTIAACFFVELGYAKPNSSEVLRGLFVPQLKGNGATGLAISLLGAMVMPHNLFLHSALVLSRKIP
ncbi:hypothetical protein PVL29_011892 [Vitis rotundifolia]|uniref:Uncharacterized protein n=1 Tax=Vitis rotundifolia TaxID=103349 RepID=A0AA38ZQ78_VITRO|nr:hypothetical protein PVL29_011892 [Vitis rotundifolia]